MIGDNFLADIRNEAGLEDVLFLGFRQLEEAGKGERDGGHQLGMTNASIQGFHRQNDVIGDRNALSHSPVFVINTLRDDLPVLKRILEPNHFIGLYALAFALDADFFRLLDFHAGLGIGDLHRHVVRIQLQGAFKVIERFGHLVEFQVNPPDLEIRLGVIRPASDFLVESLELTFLFRVGDFP